MNRLLLMTGSIACAKASGLISAWVKQGDQVKVVATRSALKFVGKATLEGLSGQSVACDAFESNQMMEHIHLSRWADVMVLCPASANVINKLSAGIADDMLTTTWIAGHGLANKKIVVPVMNTFMWEYPATQNALANLQSWGVKVIQPVAGDLACREQGVGRMPEVNDLLTQIEALL